MQDYIQAGNVRVDYFIVYKKRKTVGITVSKEGIRVLAPKWVSKSQIREIVEQKSVWILKKQDEFSKKSTIKEIGDSSELLYLGVYQKLKVIESKELKKIKIDYCYNTITASTPSCFPITGRSNLLREALILWYKKQANIIIRDRVDSISKEMGVKPFRVTIRQQKTRWGSCSSKGNISINWRLVMVPESVIDYVVVHELAHLKILNHSKDFWRLVESTLADYNDRKKLLKEYENRLNI